MAVKLMVAPAIARGELEKPDRAAARPAAPAKPKRRRSSVYDADGNEVFITLMCLKCHKMRPLAQFGLRKMADGAIRNQPWCRPCRGAAGEKPRRQDAPVPADSFAPEAPTTAASEPQPPEASRRTGSVAAEIAAALAGGRR
jgi:hypothetical protein